MIDFLNGLVSSLGIWARPLFCAFLILSGSIPLPGFGMLVVASGFLFGFPHGFFLVFPSAVLSSMLGFLVGRQLPSSWRAKMPKALTSLQQAIHTGGFTTLLLLRLTPLPFAFSNLFLGSNPEVPFWSHAAATALGFLRLALNSYLGTLAVRTLSGQDQHEGAMVEKAATLAGTLAAMLAIGSVARNALNQTSPPVPESIASNPTNRTAAQSGNSKGATASPSGVTKPPASRARKEKSSRTGGGRPSPQRASRSPAKRR